MIMGLPLSPRPKKPDGHTLLSMLKKTILLLIFFSLPAWGGQGDAPLSPPELVPASDHDPEHLTMFVTHFFRWLLDNDLRYRNTSPDTQERKHVLKEEADTIKKSITPPLRYHYEQNLRGLEETDPLFPLGDWEDNWRNTAFSQIVTLQNQTATLTVSFPPNQLRDLPCDTPFQFRVLLKIYKGAWRIEEIQDISDEEAGF